MAKTHNVEIAAKVSAFTAIKAKGFRAGVSRAKGWIKEIWTRTGRQRDRGGAVVQVDQVADHEGDRYTKTVTLKETGEVIRNVDKPLSEHRSRRKRKQ